ncbi:hypothetical protein N7491_009864 [Penicillium cf. griseofulvum]|uniref:Uncharacterized protein n=1 Tax=Penicillium cf. griseofulvum TaxID=2972120 RepID=A0A9W9MZ21_9EURO|nr:hypothetical protein N7472_000191 [Penicillium cf. griseofulvum]KAJ5421419.1 hypothetical protein N7491_009864 [Penicillium cf. griseofulvum]
MSSTSIKLPKAHSNVGVNCVPPNDFVIGTWHRSVNITYKLLPADSAGLQKLDDLVQYQGTNSEKIKSVQGLHTATPGNPGAWDWRGRGWLMIASSHWECLGSWVR